MNRRKKRSRGYSLAELLTIVGMIGVITVVTVPAFMQVLPQYRIRSAASEIAGSLRMVRTKAVSTRTRWRMEVNPSTDAYALSRWDGAAWRSIGENGKDLPTGVERWKRQASVDILSASDVIFERDGRAAASASIVLAVGSSWVRFNRYTIGIDGSGNVTITPSKV